MMIRIFWFAGACKVLILLVLLSSCRQTKDIEVSGGGVVTNYESIFANAVSSYSAAMKNGLNLDKPGAGKSPISHASLFLKYKNVFYLPIEADPLISNNTLPFLKEMTKSQKEVESSLASVCMRIIESKRKLRRVGIDHIEFGSFVGDFVVYHYD